MDLSVESCKYRLCQIDKTVKIFENVAFSGSHYFKSIYLLQARNISILDIVSRRGHSLVSSVPMRDQKNDEKGYFFSRRAVRSADII